MERPGEDDEGRRRGGDGRGDGHGFGRLAAIMDRLRDPGGCPWDAAQTLESLKPYLIEEAYEVLDVMGRPAGPGGLSQPEAREHCEELGDLLLQVVFQARLRREQGAFGIDDVIDAICDKLVRRHPHVFGDAKATTPEEALANWERRKEAEKGRKPGGSLAGVPRTLPALLRAQRTSEKAAALGFDWPDHHGVADKVREELDEALEAAEAGDRIGAAREIGDLLFAVVNLARRLEVDAEESLRQGADRFVARFRAMEEILAERGAGAASDADMDTLNAAWEEAKLRERPE